MVGLSLFWVSPSKILWLLKQPLAGLGMSWVDVIVARIHVLKCKSFQKVGSLNVVPRLMTATIAVSAMSMTDMLVLDVCVSVLHPRVILGDVLVNVLLIHDDL